MTGTLRRRLARVTHLLGLKRRSIRRANEHNRDAVLIWIPKTAGQSVTELLEESGCPKLKDPHLVRYCFPQQGLVTFGHQSYPMLRAAGLVSDTFDRSAFKFCFVRNPYDRAVSLYTYLHYQGRVAAEWSFRDFVVHLAEGDCEPVGLYNWRGMSQCNPQVDWIRDENGEVFVDWVGRFETLDTDVTKLCEELGIEGALPRRNVGDHRYYRDYYDDECRNLVATTYAEDLEAFRYVF